MSAPATPPVERPPRFQDEEELLGAVLIDPSLRDLLDRLTPSDFGSPHLAELLGPVRELGDFLTLQSLAELLLSRGIQAPSWEPGWPTLLSSLMDSGVTRRSSAIARRDSILARARKRKTLQLLDRTKAVLLESGEDDRDVRAQLSRALGELTRQEAAGSGFLQARRTYAELLGSDPPSPPELLTLGRFSVRQLALLHGRDGSRKSRLALILAVCAAAGRPDWLGIPLRPGGFRVGFLSLEDEASELWKRLAEIALALDLTTEEEQLLAERLVIISPPDFSGEFDLTSETCQELLREWIHLDRLELMILDHLTAAHSLPNELDLGPAFRPCRRIARETDCGIFLLHHDRKAGQAVKGRDLGASRGDSRFPAACRFVAHSEAVGTDLVRLTFEKSTGGPLPEPVWLSHRKDEGLRVTDAPGNRSEASAERRTRMREALAAAGEHGVTIADLAALLDVGPRTVQKYLAAEPVERIGGSKNSRWRFANEKAVRESVRESSEGSACLALAP